MRSVLSLGLALVLSCAPAPAQAPPAPTNSPEQVLEQYFAMMKEGSIFTAEGWRKMAALFERASAGPLSGVIRILPNVSKSNDISGLQRRGNRVLMDCGAGELGSIDSSLRFRPAPDATVNFCNLVLTDTHWAVGPDGRTEKAIKGPLEWRMEGSLTVRLATVDAAIAYVARMRDKTNDPAVKKNADRTIATLKRWR